MRARIAFVGLLLGVAGLGSCAEQAVITPPDDALLSRGPGAGPANQLQNFNTHLTGDEEVPAVDTRAQGQTNFQLNKDGDELRYKLIVANIQNVTMAHIHCGARGVNGPVTVWLYPRQPPPQLIPERSSGVLAEGTITDADVLPVAADHPACPGGIEAGNLDDVLEKMRTGLAYVNVHTLQFPPGEVRGQIRALGPPQH
jgi:hypothetical protein